MPHFRVFIDGSDTGTTVTAANVEDAYFDFASTTSLTYKDMLELKEIESPDKSRSPRSHI